MSWQVGEEKSSDYSFSRLFLTSHYLIFSVITLAQKEECDTCWQHKFRNINLEKVQPILQGGGKKKKMNRMIGKNDTSGCI